MATDKTNAIPTWNEVKQLHPCIVEFNTGYIDNNFSTAKELLTILSRVLIEQVQSEQSNCILSLKMNTNVSERQYHVVSYSITSDEIIVMYLAGYIHNDIGKKYKYNRLSNTWTEVQ